MFSYWAISRPSECFSGLLLELPYYPQEELCQVIVLATLSRAHLWSPLDHFPTLHVTGDLASCSRESSWILTWLTSCPLGARFVCSPYHTRHVAHTTFFPRVWAFPPGHSHSAVASPGMRCARSQVSCAQLCFSLSFNIPVILPKQWAAKPYLQLQLLFQNCVCPHRAMSFITIRSHFDSQVSCFSSSEVHCFGLLQQHLPFIFMTYTVNQRQFFSFSSSSHIRPVNTAKDLVLLPQQLRNMHLIVLNKLPFHSIPLPYNFQNH